jgi:hypothetical protein
LLGRLNISTGHTGKLSRDLSLINLWPILSANVDG